MLSSRMLATHHAQRSLDAGLIPIPRSVSTCPRKPFRMNTCKSVSKQRTLTPCRMNTYEKHRGVGGAAFLARGACPDPVGALRGVLLTSHPMRMRILGISFFFASLFCAAASLSPAFANANRASSFAPDDAADLRSAKEHFDAGDYVSARKTLQAALEKSADDPEIHFWLGRCSYELFDFNSAVASFERAVQLQPKSSLYHQWLGRAYSEKADREHSLSLARKVKKEFQTAVRLDPSNIYAHRDLAEY